MKTKSKMLWQKTLTLVLALSFIMPAVIIAQANRANFAGTWAINESKSTLGNAQGQQGQRQGQRMATGNMTVAQEANKLSVTRATMGRDGASTPTTTNYSLDGKESVNSNQRGESKSVAVWSSDGKLLTITTTRNFNGTDMKSVEVWSLNDAQTLSVKTTTTMQGGDRTITMVYDKK